MKTWQFYSIMQNLPFRGDHARCARMKRESKTTVPIISNKLFLTFGLLLPALFIGLDQLSKWATTRFFGQPLGYCQVPFKPASYERVNLELSPIMDIYLTCNPGISWGLMQGDSSIKRWALTIFAFLMVAGMMYILRRTEDSLGRWALALLIGGAVGNAIDRLFFGAVTDMIDFGDIGFHFVFNVADTFITMGVIGLFISSWQMDRKAKNAES